MRRERALSKALPFPTPGATAGAGAGGEWLRRQGEGRCSPQGLGLRVLPIPAAQRAWRFMPSDCCHQTPLGDRLAGEILLAHSMENVPEVT